MFLHPARKVLITALCLCVGYSSVIPVTVGQKKTAPVEATPPPLREEFKFGDVDLEVLEQSDLLDAKLERDGLVSIHLDEDPAGEHVDELLPFVLRHLGRVTARLEVRDHRQHTALAVRCQ